MATLTLDQQIASAAEVYKSGQTNSRKALADVKKLIKRKVLSLEIQRGIDLANDAVPQC